MLRYLILISKRNKYKFFYDERNNYEYESKSIEKI